MFCFTWAQTISGGSNESLTMIGHSNVTSDPTTWVKFPGKSWSICGFWATLLPVNKGLDREEETNQFSCNSCFVKIVSL